MDPTREQHALRSIALNHFQNIQKKNEELEKELKNCKKQFDKYENIVLGFICPENTCPSCKKKSYLVDPNLIVSKDTLDSYKIYRQNSITRFEELNRPICLDCWVESKFNGLACKSCYLPFLCGPGEIITTGVEPAKHVTHLKYDYYYCTHCIDQ